MRLKPYLTTRRTVEERRPHHKKRERRRLRVNDQVPDNRRYLNSSWRGTGCFAARGMPAARGKAHTIRSVNYFTTAHRPWKYWVSSLIPEEWPLAGDRSGLWEPVRPSSPTAALLIITGQTEQGF